MHSQIEKILTESLLGREPFQHKERLYPTQSSVFVNYGKYKRLHGKCMRASYYSCNGIKEVTSMGEEEQVDRAIQQLEGEYAERMLLDILEKKGLLISKGLKFEVPKYNICGKLDGIIQIGNKAVGLEVKSVGGNNQYTVNDIWGSVWNKPYPRWQNLFQTLVYCYAFRGVIDSFLIYYQRRDTGQRKIFTVSIEPSGKKILPVIDGIVDERFTVNELLDRYLELAKYLKEDTLPPREFQGIYSKDQLKDYLKVGIISKKRFEKYNDEPFGDFECAYCGYRDKCDGEK
jgi:hypothetical protein